MIGTERSDLLLAVRHIKGVTLYIIRRDLYTPLDVSNTNLATELFSLV